MPHHSRLLKHVNTHPEANTHTHTQTSAALQCVSCHGDRIKEMMQSTQTRL